MIGWLAAAALAADLTIGAGRAAVIQPGVAPTALKLSSPGTVSVIPSPPYLIVIGKTAGSGAITIEHDGGERRLSVTVMTSPDTIPEAGPDVGLVPAGEALALRMDEGVVCTLSPSPTATTLLDKKARVEPFGPNSYYVQATKLGVVDLVFELGIEPPRVFTIRTTEQGGDAVPEGCFVPEVQLVPPGGEVVVDTERRIRAVLVGHPDRLEAVRVEGEPTQLTLKGKGPGVTTLLVREGDRDVAWARRVIVTDEAPAP